MGAEVRFELLLDERALYHRPAGLNDAEMYKVLHKTEQMAQLSQVNMRVLPPVFTEQPPLDFNLFYRNGPEDTGQGFVSSVANPASVQVKEPDVYTLELAWANIQGAVLDAAESEARIGQAIGHFAPLAGSVEG